MKLNFFVQITLIIFVLQTVKSLPHHELTTRNLEENPSSEQLLYFLKRDDILDKVFQLLSFGTVLLTNFLKPSDISSIFAISLTRLLQYFRYTNISLPLLALERVSLIPNSASFFLDFNMPEDLKECFSESKSSSEGIKSMPSSSYLVNQWNLIVTILAIFVLRSIIYIVEAASRKVFKKKITIVVKRLKTMTSSSLIFIVLFSNYDLLTFFAIIEVQTLSLDSFFTIMSFLLCLFVSFAALYILAKVLRLTYNSLMEKKDGKIRVDQGDQSSFIKQPYGSYRIIFTEYKNDTWQQKSYFVLYLLRMIFFSAIMALFSEYLVIQMIWFIIVNVGMLRIIIFNRPIPQKFSMIITTVLEIVILIVNLCCISLMFCNIFSTSECQLQNNLGIVIFAIKAIVDIGSHVFVYIHFGLTVKSICDKAKLLDTDGKLTMEKIWEMLADSSDFDLENKRHIDSPSLSCKALSNSKKNFKKVTFHPKIIINSCETDSNLLQKRNRPSIELNIPHIELSKVTTDTDADHDGDIVSPISLQLNSPLQSVSSPYTTTDDTPQSRSLVVFRRKLIVSQKSPQNSPYKRNARQGNTTIIEEPAQLENLEASESHSKFQRNQSPFSPQRNTPNQEFTKEIRKFYRLKEKQTFGREKLRIETFTSSIINFNKHIHLGTQDSDESLSISASISHRNSAVGSPKNLGFEVPSQNKVMESQPDLGVQKILSSEKKESMRKRVLNRKFIMSQTSQIMNENTEKYQNE